MTLDAGRVLTLARDWVWVPDDATEVRTPEFHLVAYPPHFADPTMCFRVDSDRAAADLVDEVLSAAVGLGRDAVTFTGLSDATRPADLERLLRERGAGLVEELAVLALALPDGVPDLAPPPDVVVRRVDDLDGLRAHDRIAVEAFGGTPLTDEQLGARLARLAEEVGERYVAYRAGEPVGAGGLTLVGDTVRLWGAGVPTAHRHTGVYRALLAHRLGVALAAGATAALVKGRVETSAPVLERAGFRRYGTERSLRLPVLGRANG